MGKSKALKKWHQVKYFRYHLQIQEKEEQKKPEVRKIKEIVKISAVIFFNRKNSMKLNLALGINNIDKHLCLSGRYGKKNTQINSIRNEMAVLL